MRVGIAVLVASYALSQFYRMFLSVLAPALAADIGASSSDIAQATGLWFLVFAAVQIPIGVSLERWGPRLTVAVMLAVGGAGGGLIVALAQNPLQMKLAMALIGAGCAPVMIAAAYIFARAFPPSAFASLSGMVIGIGGIGNIAGTAPFAAMVAALGWRPSMFLLAVVTLAAAALVAALVQDPPPAEDAPGAGRGGSLWPLWPVFLLLFVGYAPSAGLSGGWGGPYFADVFGADAQGIGHALLVMSLAMITGSLTIGVMERLAGGARRAAIFTTAVSIVALLALWLLAGHGWWSSVLLLAVAGLFGANFPLILAYGRNQLAPRQIARGITLMNLASIGGVGVLQLVSGPVWEAAGGTGNAAGAYGTLFLFFALAQIAGLAAFVTRRGAARAVPAAGPG
ncbi:MAG: MFS transporter [Rubellimicrobium sp.]|nr:MFS transporter [Rubellimicrobium sp.]